MSRAKGSVRCFSFVVLAGLFVALSPVVQAADPDDRTVLELLNRFDRIRFAFTQAPGNGHFATTILVMKRIRKLGYTKPFELFIDPSARTSLRFLLPGYDPNGPVEQSLPEFAATTRGLLPAAAPVKKIEAEKTATYAIRTLGVIGGDDTELSPARLGVDALLTVQPPGWGKDAELRIAIDDRTAVITYPQAEGLPFHSESVRVEDYSAFLKKELSYSPEFAEKIPMLDAFFKHSSMHEIMTTYGVSYQNGPEKLAVLIDAAGKMQNLTWPGVKDGVIVPMISNFNAGEWARFQNDVRRYPSVAGRIRILPANTPEIESILQNLSRGEIVILQVGSVPSQVWNALMDRSTLPAIASGTAALNYLSLTGKTFINSVPLVPRGTLAEFEALQRATYDHLVSRRSDFVLRLMLNLRNPNSPESSIFANHRRKLLALPDKLTALFVRMRGEACLDLLGPTSVEVGAF